MLARSHERILETVDSMSSLGPRVARGSSAADDALRDAVAFFLEQGHRHEMDEEQSLFPRLRSARLQPLLRSLRHEHRTHERLARELDTVLSGPLSRADRAHAQDLAIELAASYRSHIAREDAELFPAARRSLTPAARAEVLSEMQARRGR